MHHDDEIFPLISWTAEETESLSTMEVRGDIVLGSDSDPSVCNKIRIFSIPGSEIEWVSKTKEKS